MFFSFFTISAFFLVAGISTILMRDTLSQGKLLIFWYFGVGLLVLPIFWLLVNVNLSQTLTFGGKLTWAEGAEGVMGVEVRRSMLCWQKSTLLACMLPLVVFFNYLLTRPVGFRLAAMNAVSFILISGFIFIWSNQLILIFFSFELLLLSSLYLLRLTAKSERIGEAVTEMFFWTLAGSLFLFVGFFFYFLDGVFTLDGIQAAPRAAGLASLMFLLGFGVKLPLWPCFSWLLKAHVEASVEFSILLSGVIVKFGALGIFRFMSQGGLMLNNQILAACSLLGIVEASFRLFSQRDLKRIVALTTVIELNWIGFCIAKGGLQLEQIAAFLLVAHSLTTASEFFLVECLYKRFHTRDFFFISGVSSSAPMLWYMALMTTLVTIGFPGTSLFTAKLLFFGVLSSFSITLFFLFAFFFLLFIPLFFIRLWVPVWFGSQVKVCYPDLSGREASLFMFSLGGSLLLGLCPSLVLDCI
jgi:NADH-quinone oxidoreductase subunit M